MTIFSISLDEIEHKFDDDIFVFGTIKIDDFSENFQASLSYWNRDTYLFQWQQGLTRLLNGENQSALVTTMYNPATANFIFWWVIYLVGNAVHIQNHVLFLDDLAKPFNELHLYDFIPTREITTENNEPISEWVIELSDIRAYLDSHK